jgi:AcrR family transcriptional regulator
MKPEDRKALILEYAKRLFSRNGYFSTQISDIIEEAGIARGTVYQYFKNKDDIFITLLEDYYAKWEKMMAEREKEINLLEITAREYLEYRIRMNLKFFADDRDLCNILLRVGLGLPGHLEGVVRRFESRILNVTTRDFELGQRNGHVKKDLDVELASNLFSGALLRAAYHYFGRSRKNSTSVDVEKATRQIADIFAPGIFTDAK